MKLFLIAPLLIPFVTAIVLLLFWARRRLQRIVNVIGATALFGSSILLLLVVRKDGIQAVQMGGWPAPFGITLVADLFASIMVVMAGLIGFSVAIYSLSLMDQPRESFGYYPLLHVLLMGVCGSFLTGDMFNMYVWFEVMLISSFVLMELGGERAQLEGALKYVTLNLMSSALFLSGVGILYGMAGTLNMADLARQLPTVTSPGLITTVAMLFLLAFGIKAAIFPLFFWLPASYHTPPPAVSALFAGLLTKVGVYALVRVFTLLFVQEVGVTHRLILIISGLTMASGVLGAVAHNEFRRILSFHIVSQIGYMIMGLGLFTHLGLTGSVFYIFHHIVVKTNLFLVSGVVHRMRGTYDLKSLGSLSRISPGLSALFLIPAFSLAGAPPLSGFWAKLILLQAGVETEDYAIVVVALAVGFLTLYSMTKIWNEAFWKSEPQPQQASQPLRPASIFVMYSPIILLALITILIGLATQPFLALSSRAAEQLLDSSGYIEAVLREDR
ncbi:MAG: Na+/H+ antiporter subunit D [Candidatus Abyssobacteria bacterium SURF_5]|uniref:Na+/H+ antiporter subunit D n=1 Tax=Abyssobacteria bacterium (strain SURF_5) TaxID=2093360 RepID=A0A3A4P039_ABYX5|nr:MAG: Na+/H+ antiporter subunit D [Candidatus Abyssubacteria bacterium SURF_5]